MGKRMTATSRQTLPSKKPADRDSAPATRNRERVEQPPRGNRVERVDWRGEGVVSNNHTD